MILRRRRRRLPLESRAEHSSVSAAEPQVLVVMWDLWIWPAGLQSVMEDCGWQ
jgi:hypothetical protein